MLVLASSQHWVSQGVLRMGGRVVECTGLENRQGCKPFVGSNPTPSANYLFFRPHRERSWYPLADLLK